MYTLTYMYACSFLRSPPANPFLLCKCLIGCGYIPQCPEGTFLVDGPIPKADWVYSYMNDKFNDPEETVRTRGVAGTRWDVGGSWQDRTTEEKDSLGAQSMNDLAERWASHDKRKCTWYNMGAGEPLYTTNPTYYSSKPALAGYRHDQSDKYWMSGAGDVYFGETDKLGKPHGDCCWRYVCTHTHTHTHTYTHTHARTHTCAFSTRSLLLCVHTPLASSHCVRCCRLSRAMKSLLWAMTERAFALPLAGMMRTLYRCPESCPFHLRHYLLHFMKGI